VDEHGDRRRCALALRLVEVELLDRARAVGEAQRLAQALARELAVALAAIWSRLAA